MIASVSHAPLRWQSRTKRIPLPGGNACTLMARSHAVSVNLSCAIQPAPLGPIPVF